MIAFKDVLTALPSVTWECAGVGMAMMQCKSPNYNYKLQDFMEVYYSYGYCYKSESKYMEHTRAYLAKGGDPSEVQYNCNAGDASMCHKYDINMVCHTSGGSSRCKCRDGTKWNWETKECQVYMVIVTVQYR